jgi:hypothetical protein
MLRNLPRRSVLLLAGLLVSCGVQRPPNPDPGNRLLHALAADPVFKELPPGSTRTSWKEIPAKYRGSIFEPHIWDGPRVIMTFTSSRSVREVYRFYAQMAEQAGWTPTLDRSMGYTAGWQKCTTAQFGFGLLANFPIQAVNLTESGTSRSYTLMGSPSRGC